jgi:hypothetical protein
MRFADNNAVIQTVQEWIRSQPKAFFEKGIRMLPEGSMLKTDMCK